MAFDPITGEEIKEEIKENDMMFDPMTGKPLNQPQEPMGFDPMTGKPLNQPQEPMGFDPMTGKPLNQPQAAPEPVQEPMGFDPMTGKPLNQPQAAAEPVQEQGGFDPMTGRPLGENGKKNKKNKMPLLMGAAAAVLVAVILVLGVKTGLLAGKAGRVLVAVTNTVTETPHFVKEMKPLGMLMGNKYSVSFSGEVSNVKFSGAANVNNKEKQVSAKLNYDGSKVELLGGIDSKAVKLQVPVLSKKVFVYNYKGKNTGYIVDELDDELDAINSALEMLADGTKDTSGVYKDLVKIFTKELKSLKFTSARKEEYSVNEKTVNCKGYTTVLTGTNAVHIVDGLEDLYKKHFADKIKGEDILEEVEETFDDMREEVEDMDDVTITFYIYKNKLAAIRLVNYADDEVELCFEGGDFRMQNMMFKSEGYRMQISGEDNGTEETFKLKERTGTKNTDLGSFKYNYKSGTFSISLMNELSVSGKLNRSGSDLTLKLNSIRVDYFSIDPKLEVTLSKKVKMESFSGNEFDIGNADRDDLMDLAADIQEELLDNDLYRLVNRLDLLY